MRYRMVEILEGVRLSASSFFKKKQEPGRGQWAFSPETRARTRANPWRHRPAVLSGRDK